MKRRELIKGIISSGIVAQFSSAFEVIASETIENAITKKVEGGLIENYIQFNLFGAPARWMYDNPLSPYGDEYIRPPFVATNFKGNDRFEDDFFEYSHVELNGARFPYLWSQPPLASNEKNFSELTKGFANIRGLWIGADGHIPASSKILRDQNMGSFNEIFKKKKNKFIDGVITGNVPTFEYQPLHDEFQLFFLDEAKDFQGAFYDSLIEGKGLAKVDYLEDLVLKNLRSLDDGGKEYGRRIDALKEVKKLRTTFVEEYPKIYRKYHEIFLTSRELLSKGRFFGGVFNRKVTGVAINPLTRGRQLNRFFNRFHIFTEYSDIGKGFENIQMGLWIHQFAIAEFLLLNNLSSSAILGPNNKGILFDNYKFENVYSKLAFDKIRKEDRHIHLGKEDLTTFYGSLRMDAHNTGTVFNMMGKSFFFYVFQSCLNYLVKELKAKNLYNKTLIHVASEFDRIPKSSEGGSIHNGIGQTHSLYSGSIDGPFFIGDIDRGAKEGFNYGTCNTGAKQRDLKRFLTCNDFHATLNHMISGKKSMSKDAILIKEDKGKFKMNIGRSKIV